MSFDYAEIAATATELIKEFGTQMILRSSSSEDVYDPVTGETTPGPSGSTDVPIFGVKVAPTVEYAQSLADGSVQARDMLIYMEPSVKYPNLEDTIVIEDNTVIEVWQVVNVQEIKPATVPVLYIVQVRP